MEEQDILERIHKIKQKDKKINSFITFDESRVSEEGTKQGKLSGVTFSIKSNINVRGLLTSAASKTLENYIAPYDATVVKRLKQNGALILGMANMDEFACGSSGETSFYGPTENPRAAGYITGGSSSGSAASVAAGLVDASLGSDTGGSIRNPASHCGVVCFKPTYGVVSRYGLVDLAMSLDQIGPIARDVRSAAKVMDVISGHDLRDATSLNLKENFYNFSGNLKSDIKNLKIGYAEEFDRLILDPGIKSIIHKSLDKLESEGAQIVRVKLPNLAIALPTYYLNVYVEFFSGTRKYDGRRYGHKIEDVCGEEVLRRIMLGSYISQKEYSGKYYRRALMARSLIRRELGCALKEVDVLAGPVVPKLPHKIGAKESHDPKLMYAYDVFTVPVNLAGLPAGVVPAGEVGGIPTGLQVIGDVLKDQTVLNVMRGFEKING